MTTHSLRDGAAPDAPDTGHDASGDARDPILDGGSATMRSGRDGAHATADPLAPEAVSPGMHRAALRRANALGAQLPKPRLRGMIHLITFPTAMIAGLLLVAVGQDLGTRLACVVFVTTAGLLFGISATYHRGTWQPQHALMLRRFDHANIFMIIAGTYTPLAVALLEGRDRITLLTICWAGAAVGVAFRLFWTGAPRWLYVPAYVALGWVAVFYMPQMLAGGGWTVVTLIVAGGVLYTLGALVYGLKRPNPSPTWFGFHEIFHSLTVAAFACHFAAVVLAVR